ncbi:hypothetical protein Y032_0516g2795 [Ancylostoma ceylanicum]|nr:hypothetical protein Y032_0516g2795 [Ancylostoma ceylanicum]
MRLAWYTCNDVDVYVVVKLDNEEVQRDGVHILRAIFALFVLRKRKVLHSWVEDSKGCEALLSGILDFSDGPFNSILRIERVRNSRLRKINMYLYVASLPARNTITYHVE